MTVGADVARYYLDMRAQQRQLVVLDQNIAAARGNIDLAQRRLSQGLTNAIDVSLAQRQVETLRADRAPLVAQIDASRHAISVLRAVFLKTSTKSWQDRVLSRRCRLRFRSACPSIYCDDARIFVKQSAVSPQRMLELAWPRRTSFRLWSLAGRLALKAAYVRHPPVPITWIGSLGPSLYWPLLDFGALDAQIEISDLRTHEALVAYKQSILIAVQQVDDANSFYRAQLERIKSLDRALAAARQATKIATERYDRGLTDFLNVLDAEREEFDLEARHVATRQAAADSLVALYKALGGGWLLNEPIPPIRTPQPAAIAAVKYLLAPKQIH